MRAAPEGRVAANSKRERKETVKAGACPRWLSGREKVAEPSFEILITPLQPACYRNLKALLFAYYKHSQHLKFTKATPLERASSQGPA